jgi:hypothetical protein
LISLGINYLKDAKLRKSLKPYGVSIPFGGDDDKKQKKIAKKIE